MTETRTDEERAIELEEQAYDLRLRLKLVERADDAAKLSNAISQIEHMLTGIAHLKLQREKAKRDAEEKGKSAALTDEEAEVMVIEWLRRRKK